MGKKRRRGREFVGQRNGVVRGALRLLVLLSSFLSFLQEACRAAINRRAFGPIHQDCHLASTQIWCFEVLPCASLDVASVYFVCGSFKLLGCMHIARDPGQVHEMYRDNSLCAIVVFAVPQKG
eukprot:scaffold39396_cov17-Tisochrysis_lutea.AAC.1